MLLEFQSVKKSYQSGDGAIPVLRGVSFGLDAGETLALTGESGSGKSTLLHIAGGLEQADAGSVLFADRDLTALEDPALAAFRRSDVALVFQQFNLIPSLTVADNITFQAALAGKVDAAHVAQMTAALGLDDQLTKYPEALSGGQQQRVAIARALAAKPKLLLADEPTGNLDENTADLVLKQMLDLVEHVGAAMMVVTHSPKIAAELGRQLHLKGGVLA